MKGTACRVSQDVLPLRGKCIRSVVALGLGAFAIESAVAQNLGNRPGQTPLQSNTGVGVQAACAGLGAAGAVQDPNGTQADRLFFSCASFVQTANDLDGTGATGLSLGLSNSELADSLQQLAGEEVQAFRTFATETSSGEVERVQERIEEIRSGAEGLSLRGVNLSGGDSTFPQFQPVSPAAKGERGGAASADGGWDWGRLGAFINGLYSDGDTDSTANKNGTDFDTWGITGGVDYRFLDNLVAGLAFGYSEVDADYKKSATVAGGGTDVDLWGVSVYGTYYVDNFYFDGLAGYGQNDYTIKRRVSVPGLGAGIGKAKPDGDRYNLSAGGGYNFTRGPLTYGPYARLNYSDLDVDSYREKGLESLGLNLEVNDQDATSFTSILGANVSYSLSQNFGVLVPQARLGWIHEFDNDADTIRTNYVAAQGVVANNPTLPTKADDPDENYYELGVGVSAVFEGGVQAFFQYDTWLDLDNVEEDIFTVGARLEF